jgi:spore coat polysaccharide biosynthesis predicted glycosyltransferase SpsG
MGHIVRMVELAHRLRSEGWKEIIFAKVANSTTDLLLEEAGFGAINLPEEEENFSSITAVLRKLRPGLLINDILDTSVPYMRAVRPLVEWIVNLDDRAAGLQYANLVINSLPAQFAPEEVEKSAEYLEGPTYLLLRREFRERSGAVRPVGKCRKLLITLGGSDTYGYTVKVARALRSIAELEHIEVVTGPAFHHAEALGRVVRGDPRFLLHGTVPNLGRLMATHQLAIAGGGVTLFEAALLGLPTLSIASENFEVVNAEWCERKGLTRFLGKGEALEPEQIASQVRSMLGDLQARVAMGRRGPEVVDGAGSDRIIEKLRRFCDSGWKSGRSSV